MRHVAFLLFSVLALPLFGQHISDFPSLGNTLLYETDPATQDTLLLPSTHDFQFLIKTGDPLTAGGNKGSNSDYTGFVPVNGSLTEGYVAINSEFLDAETVLTNAFGEIPGLEQLIETILDALPPGLIGGTGSVAGAGGGVDLVHIELNEETKRWEILDSRKADFGNFEAGIPTGVNCSGSRTPWETVVTCEEISSVTLTDELPAILISGLEALLGLSLAQGLDLDQDGYADIGWCVEIDPKTGKVVDYDNDGTLDKLWQMGNLAHENISEPLDSVTVYFGEDNGSGEDDNYLYKFIADEPGNLSSGTLYTFVLDGPWPATKTGRWVQIPNKTIDEQFYVSISARDSGAWNVPRVEDVEIGPDGAAYIVSTAWDVILRLEDDATDPLRAEVELWVNNTDYNVENLDGTTDVVTFNAPDNLQFDDEGNFYVMQDGGNRWIYMVHADHTPADPHISVFARFPFGCEPTGMTFSEDFKYMFVSAQHPSETNSIPQEDVGGTSWVCDADITYIIARNETWGKTTARPAQRPQSVTGLETYPNPVLTDLQLRFNSDKLQTALVEVSNNVGYVVLKQEVELTPGANAAAVDVSSLIPQLYFVNVRAEDGSVASTKFIKMR